MPTVTELVTATRNRLDAVEAELLSLRAMIATAGQDLEKAEKRRAKLKTRLEVLQDLEKE